MELSICLLCPSFDIGGAETHVLTLAEALSREGHRVTVVSAGGLYVKRAKGVFRHITVPLNKKSRALYSLLRLHRLFRRERFDVIHSHARFPSFLCHLLGVRFVSTAHWVFSNRFPYRTLSFWGSGTLAVSEDIRTYLNKEHGIKENDITVTVNGIDTDRFFSDKSDDRVYRICHCSRLDSDRSFAAFLLCDAVEMLYPDYTFTLSIVGDGGDFEAIKEKAAKVNAKAKRPLIHLIGATDAVEEHLDAADIFVGVSRAALEAMSAECAVVLAGNEGYLSVFSPQKSQEAEKTNFCCRDAVGASVKLLAEDLRYLLSLPKEMLHAQGKENRAYVEQNYSAERMAKDALCVYDRVLKKKAILCGYYGFGNIGDALMHRSLSARLRREGYKEIHTLSAKKFSLSSLYALYKGYDFFLGGGNLLQDESSLRSLRFYYACARFALARGSRVSLLSSGFGTFTKGGERIVKKLLPHCKTVECRTEGDFRLAHTLGAKNATLSHDAVLDLAFGIRERTAQRVMLTFRTPTAKKQQTELFTFCLQLCHIYKRENLFFFAMHPSDSPYLRKLSKKLGVAFVSGGGNAFIKALKGCTAVYSSRLHAAVCALRVGVPAFLSDEDEKSRFFAKEVEKSADALSLPCAVKLFSLSKGVRHEALPSPLSILRVCEAVRGKKKEDTAH